VVVGYNSSGIILILVAGVNVGLTSAIIRGCKTGLVVGVIAVASVGASTSVEGLGKGYCRIGD